jgi:hypothetical protein
LSDRSIILTPHEYYFVSTIAESDGLTIKELYRPSLFRNKMTAESSFTHTRYKLRKFFGREIISNHIYTLL